MIVDRVFEEFKGEGSRQTASKRETSFTFPMRLRRITEYMCFTMKKKQFKQKTKEKCGTAVH